MVLPDLNNNLIVEFITREMALVIYFFDKKRVVEIHQPLLVHIYFLITTYFFINLKLQLFILKVYTPFVRCWISILSFLTTD